MTKTCCFHQIKPHNPAVLIPSFLTGLFGSELLTEPVRSRFRTGSQSKHFLSSFTNLFLIKDPTEPVPLGPSDSDLGSVQDAVEGEDLVNGIVERGSKEPSPAPSPVSGRKSKNSQSSTLPAKNQDSSSQLEGFLHRKHEWEGHNKKASNR